VISRRLLFLLLLLLAADFAVPYELTARGVIEADDQEEALRGQVTDAPAPTLSRALTTGGAARARLARRPPTPRRRRGPALRRVGRRPSSPPSPTEDH
jgi:hypothetical protein